MAGLGDRETARDAVERCGRLLGRAVAVARSEASRSDVAAKASARAGEADMEARADRRASRRLVAMIPVPFLRPAMLARMDADVARLTAGIEAHAHGKRLHRKAAAACREGAREAEAARAAVSASSERMRDLGPLPRPLGGDADDCARRCVTLGNAHRDIRWVAEVVRLGDDCSALVAAWAAATDEARRRRADEARRAERAREAGPAGGAAQRIYLPVSHDASRRAVAAGAGYDADAAPGLSRAYVSPGMDLSRFKDMMPLAARPTAPGFDFPPIPFAAAGQNLHALFDAATWDHVRRSCTAMTGKRCAVCGKTGGWFAKNVLGKDGNRNGVDCHEVWDWSVPDPASGTCVQRLKRILVVCPDCHMTFHGDFAVKRARDVGLDAEAADAVKRRRMAMNRVGAAQLDEALESTRGRLKAMLSGIDTYVLDLAYLGAQQYMADRTPVFVEGNKAGIAAEHVAGLAFETDAGRTFATRDAHQVRASLVDRDADQGYNVHHMHARR